MLVMGLSTILLGALGWWFFQLTLAPRDRAVRALVLCLMCAGSSHLLAVPGGASGIDAVAGSGSAKLGQNLLLMLTVFFLLCFYIYAADAPLRKTRIRREAAVALAAAAFVTVVAASAPGDALAGSYASEDMTVTSVAMFYLSAGLYLIYALATAGVWSLRYARLSSPPQSTGLWMAGAGMLGMAAASLVRAVSVAVRWRGGEAPKLVTAVASLVIVAAVVLFVVGLTYPGVRMRAATVRLWLQHRRDHRRLEPLWRLVSDAFPGTVLKQESASLRDRLRARGVHRRYQRRVVECRDGLVGLSPYLPAGLDGASAHKLGAAELAAHLRRAAAAVDVQVPAPRAPIALAMPGDDGPDTDVHALIALADALAVAHHTIATHQETRPC